MTKPEIAVMHNFLKDLAYAEEDSGSTAVSKQLFDLSLLLRETDTLKEVAEKIVDIYSVYIAETFSPTQHK